MRIDSIDRTLGWAPFGVRVAVLVAVLAPGCREPLSHGDGGASSASTSGVMATTSSGSSASSSGNNSSAVSSGEGGGRPGCATSDTCPGVDTACRTRTCEGGLCGETFTPQGQPAADQTAGDCALVVCDGAGDTENVPDDQDVGSDSNSCTTDGCSAGAPVFTPVIEGAACGPGNTKFCKSNGSCVECLIGSDCPNGVCTAQNTCGLASCQDSVKNGAETDVDCGGPACSHCAEGGVCGVNSDCASGSCVANLCAPSCTDGELNQEETDVDCGGPTCLPCNVGAQCFDGSDCASASCAVTFTCNEYLLLLSEFRSRGPMGGSDEFVELYNPFPSAVVLPTDIALHTRSDTAGAYSIKWTSSGQIVPAHGHLLIVGSAYSGAAVGDDLLSGGITDKASLMLVRGAAVLDAACVYCGATNPFDATYTCEGSPFILTGCTSNNADRSLERLPGGGAGSATDSGNTAMDFHILAPAHPESLQDLGTP